MFSYDNSGNILVKYEYPFTLGSVDDLTPVENKYSYTASNGDRLKAYNGEQCTYDVLGNPTVYRGKKAEWSHVNRMDSFNGVNYKYNYAGIRTRKTTADNVVTKYYYAGEDLLVEDNGTMRIAYIYGADGVSGFRVGPSVYYYLKNRLGDVCAIVDASGNIRAKYVYDAFGNHKVLKPDGTEDKIEGTIGNVNPFRYRGYYFDVETGLYYLQSRYYDPETGRFITADSVEYLDLESVNGLNLYSYCGNNPVMYVDPSGCLALTTFGIWAIIGIVSAATLMGGTVQLVSNALAGKTGCDLWRGVVGAALGSGLNALALCTLPLTGGASLAVSALIGAGVQTGVDTIETLIRGEDVSLGQTTLDLFINFATAFAGNWLGSKIIPTNPGWFKPQKFMSVFTKPYGQKILLQIAIGATLSGTVNFYRKFDWKNFDWKKLFPIRPITIDPLQPRL